MRINHTSDDAAGLSVASSLTADRRIFSQGVRNLNDGLSALNIADGAVGNLSAIVMRLQELAEQASSGTLGAAQRKSLNDEAQALSNEYFRISKTASFNGLKLLDGSVSGFCLQAGYGTSGTIAAGVGGAIGTGALSSSGTAYGMDGNASRALVLGDLNNDGAIDMVTAGSTDGDWSVIVRLGKGDGTYSNAASYSTAPDTEMTFSYSLALHDLDEDGILDLVTGGYGSSATTYVLHGVGDGSFSDPKSSYSYGESNTTRCVGVADLNGDGISDFVSGGGGYAAGTSVTVRIGNGDGTFSNYRSYASEAYASNALALSDINKDGIIDLITAGKDDINGIGKASVRLGIGDGSFSASRIRYDTESGGSWALSIADINNDGNLDMVTSGAEAGGKATVRFGRGDGTFSSTSTKYNTEDSESRALALADLNDISPGNQRAKRVSQFMQKYCIDSYRPEYRTVPKQPAQN